MVPVCCFCGKKIPLPPSLGVLHHSSHLRTASDPNIGWVGLPTPRIHRAPARPRSRVDHLASRGSHGPSQSLPSVLSWPSRPLPRALAPPVVSRGSLAWLYRWLTTAPVFKIEWNLARLNPENAQKFKQSSFLNFF